jgi:hypothetical protein
MSRKKNRTNRTRGFRLRVAVIGIAVLFYFGRVPIWAQGAGVTSKAGDNPTPSNYQLPAESLLVEEQPLDAAGHPDKTLVLWMVKPEKHPHKPDDIYTCPDYTRGSHYTGPTRVSLADRKTGKIINTIEIKQEYNNGEDSFDVPYAIRKGYQYAVEGHPKAGEEAKPHLLLLKDYNGDGKALEFALFDAEFCMGLETTLIGYSERQGKVIQYPIRLTEEGERRATESHWCDYLFSKKPTAPGKWKYQVNYSGRGGDLEKYDIRYSPEKEAFEGTHTAVSGD